MARGFAFLELLEYNFTMNELTKTEHGDETFTEMDKSTGELVTYCVFTGEVVNKQSYDSDLATRFKYTPEIGDVIADMVRAGGTLTKIAQDSRLPNVEVIYRWKRRYPDFARALREAREDRAEYYADKAIETIEAATDKDDVAVAKEQVKIYQWESERANPKDYGKKSEVKIEAEVKSVPMFVIDTGINRDDDIEDVEYEEVDNEAPNMDDLDRDDVGASMKDDVSKEGATDV